MLGFQYALQGPWLSCLKCSNCIRSPLQAADFLADEFAIRYACVELSDRMFKTKFGSTEGAPVSNKWKSGEDRAGKASREYTQIQERKDANEKVITLPP